MAHIKKLNFLKNYKDLVDENYGMVAVPTFSDKMDKDLAELFKSQNKTGKVGDLVFEIDNNSILILEMLNNTENVTSNDIVSALVKNGLSLDYASKIKNKVIESLNDKFNFLTNLDEPFIKLSKSKIDKRIQVLNLLKI